ncbi:MAG: hypothetical protein HZB62_10470 [Nitrospirae bacterium]|nr:hypothetical protein [Nitrospirota bacterium]
MTWREGICSDFLGKLVLLPGSEGMKSAVERRLAIMFAAIAAESPFICINNIHNGHYLIIKGVLYGYNGPVMLHYRPGTELANYGDNQYLR